MYIKEYRIALPLSVDEYRIAQLYMIQKKSRNESSGKESGVEILVNEPYTDGPGGDGQYTYKVYHIGSHLPGWFRAILPKSALRVEEEAWNAYPYTKTIYRCPFIEKFLLEIETRYFNDGGTQENVFNLPEAERRARTVDFIDIVKDSVSSSEYKKEEDPKLYKSAKTGRGPLSDNWREEYIAATSQPNHRSDEKIMCAYKLCKVEFRYWGMQNKIERFIHDIGLRKTMVSAHRQAWTWQDEWFGLELDDIRKLEKETQRLLAEKMGEPENEDLFEDGPGTPGMSKKGNRNSFTILANETVNQNGTSGDGDNMVLSQKGAERRSTWSSSGRRSTLGSSKTKSISEADWRIEKLETLQDESSDDDGDLFYDAFETLEEDNSQPVQMARNSSCDTLNSTLEGTDSFEEYDDAVTCGDELPKSDPYVMGMRKTVDFKMDHQIHSFEAENGSTVGACRTTVLFLVLHGGSLLDAGNEQNPKHADISTLRATFDSVVKSHYPHLAGHICVRLIPCPATCADTINTLLSISPFVHDSASDEMALREFMPLAAIPLLVTSNPDYYDSLTNIINKANVVYNDFLKSDEGVGFNGQVCLIGDSLGGVLGYDALCQSSYALGATGSMSGSQTSLLDIDTFDCSAQPKTSNLSTIHQLSFSNPDLPNAESEIAPDKERPRVKSEAVLPDIDVMRETRKLSPSCSTRPSSASRRTSRSSSTVDPVKFDFEVSDFFMFGSPLALVLTHRRVTLGMRNGCLKRPACHQLYNLFHLTDPSAARLEPLVEEKFRHIRPIEIPRYQKFPLGDGQSSHLVETIQSNARLFNDGDNTQSPLARRESSTSIMSQMSGLDLPVPTLAAVINKWWGMKRVDYALYTPEALNSFPLNSLPDLFHARYWESQDVVAFILRQLVRHNTLNLNSDSGKNVSIFQPTRAREKWIHRRTALKVRNVAANHRANDVLILEDQPQVLGAKFMYGPFDVVALSGEKVDVHVMTQPPAGEWEYFDTVYTDSHGRVTYTIPSERRLIQGMYPVKMVVRGDHTCVDFFLTVLPPHTESAIFSIDGSFTASMSIMGRDPKVRAGAVDVVRHWQELGYLIIYISARPDLQHKKVVAWLAQHNFPHGMVAFMDGISAEPLRQKGIYLRNLKDGAGIDVQAAYGSNKDITVYQSVGVTADKIFIVGKSSKKVASQAQLLVDGYAAHLHDLNSSGRSRSAKGNARFFLRKSCFGLPGQLKWKKKQTKRCISSPSPSCAESPRAGHTSYPAIGVSQAGNTMVDAGQLGGSGMAVRSRGASPRLKLNR